MKLPQVKTHVPADRLLVFQVHDGWGPLCKFLEREAPAGIPFPHLNEGKATLEKLAREHLYGPWLRKAPIVLGIAAALAVLVWWFRRK
jgi:hypothetical protein